MLIIGHPGLVARTMPLDLDEVDAGGAVEAADASVGAAVVVNNPLAVMILEEVAE